MGMAEADQAVELRRKFRSTGRPYGNHGGSIRDIFNRYRLVFVADDHRDEKFD